MLTFCSHACSAAIAKAKQVVDLGLGIASPLLAKYGIVLQKNHPFHQAAEEVYTIIQQYNLTASQIHLFLAELLENAGRSISGNRNNTCAELITQVKQSNLKEGEHLIVLAEEIRILHDNTYSQQEEKE